ncbi:MAG TPA: hypothetical protein VM101_15880, partial [Flavitalea sp.]|nr:hypothetical protein [Flavitalea sp.]
LCVVSIHGFTHAQEPLSALRDKKLSKPSLFTSLPEKMEVTSTELHAILSRDINENFISQVSGQLVLEGTVVEKNQHTPGSLSLNIRVHNYHDALFNLTIRFLADNSTAVKGRIIHPQYGDVLELYKENDKYYFKKISQRLYMPD